MKNRHNDFPRTVVLAALLAIFAVPFITAQQVIQAVIREIAGTVEIKRAGSETWEAANRGQNLSWDTTISTGFRSTAVIAIGDSLLTVRPLTRLTLLELSQNQGNEKVELNLQSGRLKADVKPPEGGKTEFVVRSPNSTSSVRGTIFEFDTLNIEVRLGTVAYAGLLGSTYLLDAVGYSRVDEITSWASPPSRYPEGLNPELPNESDPIQVSSQPPGTSPSQPSNPGSGPSSDPSTGSGGSPGGSPGNDGFIEFIPDF